jgi:hypothetical protein
MADAVESSSSDDDTADAVERSSSDDDTAERITQAEIIEQNLDDVDNTREEENFVHFDPCALLLQYFLDSKDLSTEHVSYQSFFHLLLGAGGLLENAEMRAHVNDFKTLR